MFFPKGWSVKKTVSSFLAWSNPILLLAPGENLSVIDGSSFSPQSQAIKSAVIVTRYPEASKSYHFCQYWSVLRHNHLLFGLIQQAPIIFKFIGLSPSSLFFFLNTTDKTIHWKPKPDYATSLLKSLQGVPTSFRTKAKVLNDGLQGPSQSASHVLSQTPIPLWHQLYLSLPGLLLQPHWPACCS